MPAERTISSQRLYEGRILNLRLDQVELPGGRQALREIVEHRNAVAVVALDAAERVILVRQYRRAADKTLLEIPAGLMDPGEDPLEAVRRELREETGYQADKIEKLGGFYSSPGFSTEFLYLFLATGLHPGTQHTEMDEDIEVEKVPLAQIPSLIASGAICDAKSVAGLLLALAHLGQAPNWR